MLLLISQNLNVFNNVTFNDYVLLLLFWISMPVLLRSRLNLVKHVFDTNVKIKALDILSRDQCSKTGSESRVGIGISRD